MENKKPKFTKEEKDNIVQLYQQLTIDQCRELYLKQKNTLNAEIITIIMYIIASKVIYGEKGYLEHITKLKKSENSK